MSSRILVVAVAFAVIGSLGACASPSTSSTSDAAESGTVNFVASDDPSAYEAVIASFEESHPKVTVKYTQIPFADYNSTIQQRLLAKDTSIDVLAVDQPRMSQLAAQNLLVDLSDLKSRTEEAVSPSQYDVSVYEDKLWSVPMSNSTQVLYYNKTLLDAANVSVPSVSPSDRMTWEQIEIDGTAAQAAGSKYGILFEQPYAYYEIEPLMVSAGGGTGIAGADGLTAAVTTDGWDKALNWYAGLYSSGLAARGVGNFQTNAAFSAGDSAYFIGGPWDVSVFAATDLDWGIAPMPYFEGGEPSTPTGSWSLGINPASEKQVAAKEFTEYLTLDEEGATLANAAAGNLTSNLAAQSTYLSGLDSAAGSHSAGASELMNYEISNTATARPSSVGYPQFEDATNKAIEDITNGAPVKSRLAELQSSIASAWKQLQ